MTTKQNPDFNSDEESQLNPVFQFSRIDFWLKGVGFYYLVFIFIFNVLKRSSLSHLIPEERLESIVYITLVISSLYLPFILGKWLDILAWNFIKMIKSNQSEDYKLKLKFFLLWILSLIFNSLAIKKIALENGESYDVYFTHVAEILNPIIAGVNFISLMIFSIIILFLYLIVRFLSFNKRMRLVAQNLFLLIFMVAIAFFSWNLFYISSGLYHLNVVLFPLVTILNNSPSLPMVSDGFISLYGGYFLWMQLPLKIFGANLLSIQVLFHSLILLQILMYFLISRCLINKQSIAVVVFISSTFWSYLFFRAATQEMYFQYFPLRLLFPSVFIIIAYTFEVNKRLQKNFFSIHNLFSIRAYDILLITIVSLALLNNLDSGLSTLGMYIALYGWDIFNNQRGGKANFNYFIVWTIASLFFIIIISILIFRFLSGSYPNLFLYLFSSMKFGSGFFGLPFPDNLWILFVLFYAFTLIKYSMPVLNCCNAKFKFIVAIWGLISMIYFVNRSHPYNLLHISFPFFLCCGFLFENYWKVNLELGLKKNQVKLKQIIQKLKSFEKNKLLQDSSAIVYFLPFLIASILSLLLFIPALQAISTEIPLVYSYPSSMSQIRYLSSQVNKLEKKLNRPSILISDTESYFYLLEKRKVLFYPESASIFDESFEKRLAHILDDENPIVVLCPLLGAPTVTVDDLKKLLIKNRFQLSQSVNQCMIYLKN